MCRKQEDVSQHHSLEAAGSGLQVGLAGKSLLPVKSAAAQMVSWNREIRISLGEQQMHFFHLLLFRTGMDRICAGTSNVRYKLDLDYRWV